MNVNNLFVKSGISLFSKLMPYSVVKKINKRDLIIPLYHAVSDSRVAHIENIYPVKDIKNFEKDLDFFMKFYHPISFPEFYNRVVNQKKVDKPSFLLTFDDGLAEFKEVITPILLKKGIPALCFINTSFLDNKFLFYRHKASLLIDRVNKLDENIPEIRRWKTENFDSNCSLKEMILSINYNRKHILDELALIIKYDWDSYLVNQKPYLFSEDVISLQNKGFHFGAHSIDHPRYNLIDSQEQIKQTKDSINFMSERFKIKEKLFAFPFSDRGVDKTFFEEIYKQGITDITFGTSGFDTSRLYFRHQQRISFDENLNAKGILCMHSLYQAIRPINDFKNKIINKYKYTFCFNVKRD
jgi:peptidoglycan/xylan/chitin deacetylase (PgdA/CDA1 family)